MEPIRGRNIGIALIVLSAIFFSIAGVFTKMVEADASTIVGWRGLVGTLLLGVFHLWQRRRDTNPAPLILDSRGWFVAWISVFASAMFIASLKYTYVANVAVIYATAPFMAAGLGWVFLRERVSATTLLTAVFSLAGVVVIVYGGLGSASLVGDTLALLMTVMFAIYIVATRAFPETPAIWSVAVASLILFGVSWIATDPLAISAKDLAICILFGFTFSVAVILLTEGAKRLPVADTAVIGTLDVPLAVGFAWIFLSEAPPRTSIVGGGIVVAAVLGQSMVEAMRSRGARLQSPCR